MTANHILLRRITLSASASSVTFDSIPQTGYTDLKVVISARTDSNDGQVLTWINGDTTTSNYSRIRLIGEGGSGASSSSASDTKLFFVDPAAFTANTFGNTEIYIPNYSSSNKKSISVDSVLEYNNAYAIDGLFAGLWNNTSAITSIQFVPQVGNFVQYSSFSLYGIADVNTTPLTAPKADGGDIIKTDGAYWYHAFLSSGTFKPQLNLTADILQIAGGGGGGYGGAGVGGGGAGGLLAFTSQALTTTNYTCTVGSGGPGGTSTNGTQGGNSQFGSLTASVGGGYGGGSYQVTGVVGGDGGSGGGAGAGNTNLSYGQAGGSPTSGQGYAGGVSQPSEGGGGGGAGASPGTSRNGGNGLNTYSSWATATGAGVSGYYAGGGGGSIYPSGYGTGGAGGGGQSGQYSVNGAVGVAGVANTGSGGGGAGYANNNPGTQYGGAGGSGIIIIRYPV